MRQKPNTRIMIIDDDKEFIAELQELVSLSGYDVDVLSDGSAAMERIKAYRPQVLIMDLRMSPKSGFDIIDEIKQDHLLADLKIIAMTGYISEKKRFELMRNVSVKSLLFKPIQPLNVISRIEFELTKQEDVPGVLNVSG